MAALVVAEHSNAALNEATHKAVSAAAALGGPVHVLVAGQNAGAAAAAAGGIAGVSKFSMPMARNMPINSPSPFPRSW